MMAASKEQATKSYRVVVVGVSYFEPVQSIAPDGSETTLQVYRIAHQGDLIDLTDAQAANLQDKGSQRADGTRGPAVKPADSPQSYDEMKVADLEDLAKDRGLEVRGTGANGAVLKEDLVNALGTFDQGAVPAA